jgi:hypothetical protein
MAEHVTRESWLNHAHLHISAHLHQTAGVTVPTNIRFSVGFPGGRGKKNTTIGQCWSHMSSKDGTFEVFISPVLGDPLVILATQLHEEIHAAVGLEAGHKAPFKKAAIASGLTGKMTATVATDDLKAIMAGWLVDLGPLPHAAMSPQSRTVKQTTRLIKCQCQDCGYTVRTTAKWLEVGTPICQCNGEPMVAE